MSEIIQIKGNVRFPITLDPSLWIIDDRKKPLQQFFQTESVETDAASFEEEDKRAAIQWERNLKEGAVPTGKSEKRFVDKKRIEGDYGMSLAPFLNHAEPNDRASEVILHLANETKKSLALEEAKRLVLCFAIDGKPIRENGPVYVYYGDGSNIAAPFKGLHTIEIR